MKKFENITTGLVATDKDGKNHDMSRAELVAQILDIVPQGGWTTDIMRQRIPLQVKLKALKPGGNILLENAEVSLINEVFQSKPKFNVMHEDIISLEDYISKLTSAPDEKVKPVKK